MNSRRRDSSATPSALSRPAAVRRAPSGARALAAAAGLLALGLGGCASSRAVTELSLHQVDAYDALLARLEQQLEPMELALYELRRLDADYTAKAFELERELARAEKLDAMNAPWAHPDQEWLETQRAVMLYNLYEVDRAEDLVLSARLAERQARIDQVFERYETSVELVRQAVEHVDAIAAYLGRSRTARLQELTGQFLDQVRAFGEGLEGSDSPRLRALAEKTKTFEEEAREAEREADRAIANLLRARSLAEGGN